MNLKHLTVLVGVAALLVSSRTFAQEARTGASNAEAVEVSAPSRTLRTCYFKTQNTALALTAILKDAFTPTSVFCPIAGSCTVHVEVSSQISGIDVGTAARMNVKVNGVGASPAGLVNVAATPTALSSTHTFQWIRTGLGSGLFGLSHTVDVEMNVSAGAASAGFRTLKICVFKP